MLLAQTSGHKSDSNNIEAYRYETSKNTEVPASAVFNFDPNTLDADGWRKLGLRDRTVQTILHYREKGGHFYKPDDVQKIWGLPNGFYSRVKGYIQIAAVKKDYGTSANPSTSPGGVFFKTPYERSERRLAAVDVNTADTSALIALPGIGSKLAQ